MIGTRTPITVEYQPSLGPIQMEIEAARRGGIPPHPEPIPRKDLVTIQQELMINRLDWVVYELRMLRWDQQQRTWGAMFRRWRTRLKGVFHAT